MTRDEAYDALGLAPGATPDEITQAYRRLSMRHHPDREGGDPAVFAELSEAYRLLHERQGSKAAEALILGEFRALFLAHDLDGDWVARIAYTLMQRQGEQRGRAAEAHDIARRMARYLGRVRRRSEGRNLFDEEIEAQVSAARQAAQEAEAQVKVYTEAREMLNDYDFTGARAFGGYLGTGRATL